MEEHAVTWLFEQLAVTVLLFCIIGTFIYFVLWVYPKISKEKNDIEKLSIQKQAEHTETLKNLKNVINSSVNIFNEVLKQLTITIERDAARDELLKLQEKKINEIDRKVDLLLTKNE